MFKLTSFGCQTLAEKFSGVQGTDLQASYMQIEGGDDLDLDAGDYLHLEPQPEH